MKKKQISDEARRAATLAFIRKQIGLAIIRGILARREEQEAMGGMSVAVEIKKVTK